MARVTNPGDSAHVLTQTVVKPLLLDYLSQTDATNQAIVSNLLFPTGKFLQVNSLPVDFPWLYQLKVVGAKIHVQKDDCATLTSYDDDNLEDAVAEAFGGLPAGRIGKYKETVAFKGLFTKYEIIQIPEWCRVKGDAYIKNGDDLAVAKTKILGTAGEYIDIEDLTLDGNRAENLDATGGSGQGVNLQITNSNVNVRRLISTQARSSGVEPVGYSDAAPLRNIRIYNSDSVDDSFNGFGFSYNIQNSLLHGCRVHGIGDIAYNLSAQVSPLLSPMFNTIEQCTAEDFDGILGSSAPNHSRYGFRSEGGSYNTIQNNAFIGCGDGGLYDNSVGVGWNKYLNNTISMMVKSWTACLQFVNHDNIARGNTLIAGTNQDCIQIYGDRNIIEGNICKTASGGTGILEDAGADSNAYGGNNLVGCATKTNLNGTNRITLSANIV